MPDTTERYLDVIRKDTKASCTDDQLTEKLLDRAWATREFEIELYWKRAIYFWGFTAALGAALLASMNPQRPLPVWLQLMICALGCVFSFAWYRSAQGSKFWQENWEAHVDLLEDLVHGKLYKTVIKPKRSRGFLEGAPYSVSRINQIACLSMVAAWFATYLCVAIANRSELTILATPSLIIIWAGIRAVNRCGYTYNFEKEFKDSKDHLYHVRGTRPDQE